jgi:flagellar hook-associated protein FlgK
LGASAGLATGDTIGFSGTTRNGTLVAGSYGINIANTAQGLLTFIQTTFGNVTAAIDSNGSISITDNIGGASQLALSFTIPLPHSLNFGAVAEMNQDIKDHPENIAAGLGDLGDLHPGSPGDNRNALQILSIQADPALIIKQWIFDREVPNSLVNRTLSLDDYYRTLVGDIGTLTEGNLQQYEFTKTMVDNLNDVRDSISGVNLDEELTKLMELQMAYKAAAKLVTAADELYTTILQM